MLAAASKEDDPSFFLPELPVEAFGVYRGDQAFAVKIEDHLFAIEQSITPNAGYGITSCFLWSSSVGLAQFVHRCFCVCGRSCGGQPSRQDSRVLELAAGFALPSRVLSHCGGSPFACVVATEIGEPLRALRLQCDGQCSASNAALRVAELDWNNNARSMLAAAGVSEEYDMVLAADCLYDQQLHAPLIRVIGETLSSQPACTVCRGRVPLLMH